MDSCIQNMYDAFKDEIWKELGPLDPNWFEVLTAQASLNEGNVADNDELCANQEGYFKVPLEKTAVESQLFSTPKVFRHCQIVSPDTEDDSSFTAVQEKEMLPWMPTQSPCLFQPPKLCVSNLKCEGVQPQSEASFDLLHSPEKSPASYANHISESLGAQINPDISWTSSFNTPRALPSTLILSKTDESPCPESVTADRKVVFVRKLFPSLSNSSLKTSRTSLGPVFPVTDTCSESPLNQSESHQQQKVPDALEGDVCSADAPRSFFANSSSALRKVKPDRVKRKQIIQTNVDVCSHEDTSKSDNAASSEEDLESGGLPSTTLVKTGDTAISQWSPLSLSEISSSAVGSNMTLPGYTDSVQPTRPTLKITDSGFTQKKRKFVYTITTTKSQACGQDFQTTDPSLKISESEQENGKPFLNTPDKEECQRTKNQRNIVEETINCSLGTKLQDIDMSQLCRDFAQDFSQMTDLKTGENTQRNFSPAACLSAMKQTKQNGKPANFPNDYSCISKNRCIPTINQPFSISEVTMIDSGFQSGVADVTHMTSSSFGLPLLENVGQNQPKLSFKTGMHNFPSTNGSGKPKFDVEVPVQRSGTGQAPDHAKEIELDIASISTEELWDREETIGESKSSQPQKTPVSLLPADASGFKTASNKGIHISLANLEKAKHCFEATEDKKSSLDNSTKSYHGIIYKSNSICEKTTDTSSDSSLPACAGKSFGNVSSQLTASEKADVTELCTLLEEADSQFEFTQFKSTKKLPNHQDNHNPPQKEDKDLDPALLADIDFDDSFISEGGKHSTVMMNDKVASVLENRTHGETAKAINRCTGMSDLLKTDTHLNSLSGTISEEREFLKLDEPNILPRAEDTETRYLENNKALIHSEAFRTAGGNVLHVSKKCLNKAKALFADLERNLTDQKLSDKQNGKNAAITEQKCNRDSDTFRKDSERKKENWDVGSKIENCFSKLEGAVCSNKNVGNRNDTKSVKKNEIDTIICENGFRKASGKGISISANYMQEADAFFKDCHVMEHKEGKKSFSNFKSPQVIISKKSVTGCTELENVNTAVVSHHTKERRLNEVERNSKFTAALKNEDGKSFPTSKPFAMLHPSKSTDLSAFEELCTGDGFCTASGKNISVSAAAMKKDESLLNQIHAPEEINKETNEKEKASKTKCLGDELSNLDDGGFQVVNGKKFAISSAPLKKPTLLRESDKSEDAICISSQQSSPKTPVIPVTNLWSGGFSAASGKPVVLSSVALEKTQTLVSDISLNMDKVAESAPVKKDKKHQTEPEKICSGFTTAGGANDQMSQEKFDDLILAKAVQEEDALSTDSVLESNNVMLESVGSKKEDEKPHADQRFRTQTPVEAVKECFKDADKQEKHKENLLPQASCGFKTASGKKVEVSFEALKKAENLLGDCVGVMDRVNAVLPESKAIDLPVRNDGFQSASGKPVALSSEALQKAKSLFSDIGFRAEDPDTSQMRKSGKNQDGSNNTEKMSCGFTTARGEKVDVLQKNLQKAKALFKELDDQVLSKAAQEEDAFFAGCDMDINKEMLENDLKDKVHMQRSRKASLAKCYTDDEMRVSISIPECSSNANKQVEQRENILPQASRGFQTASGKRVDVSSEALKKAETLFSEFEGIQDKTNAMSSQSQSSALSLRNCGFHSASGKPMAPSTEAVQKAKSLFCDITSSTEDSDFSQTVKADGKQDSRSKTQKICCGFTTAKGEKVDVSQKNLQRAKFLFKEVDDLALTKAMQDTDPFFNQQEGWTMDSNSEKSSEQTNTAPVNESGSIKGNMSELRTNTGSICEEPESGSIKAKQNEGGFQTASGKTVAVSAEALSRAKLLLSENKADEESTCVFAASGKPFSHEALQKAKTYFSSGVESLPSAADSRSDDHIEEKSHLSICNLNTKSCNQRSDIIQTNKSSDPKFQLLNLTGCTETQQKFLAQEALDCTKALLEDEFLVGQSLLTTSEDLQLLDDQHLNKKSAEEDKGRKRRRAEDLIAQPPSKRRLLEEFDRTAENSRGSGLHPVKSGPNGIMDRGVFRCGAFLHPNITKPNRDAKSFVHTRLQRTIQMPHSDQGDGRSAACRMPTFVPPFFKNSKRDALNKPEARDRKKVPAFVPPFKKQRVVHEESSPKQQEDNKQHHSLCLETNSKTDAPLTKTTQNCEEVVTLVNTPNTKMINQSVPLKVGSVSSTEMLHVDDKLSRSQDRTENIGLARDMQDMRIRKKKRQTIRPLPGSLFLTKTSGVARIPLKAAVNGNIPSRYSAQELYECGVHKYVPEITGENAESFRFNLLQFVKQEMLADGGGVQLADGGWLIPSDDWTAGKEEFYRALCDTSGVDPKLISEQWVYNHYRWIVWKQASMEKSFPETMGSLCLTPEQVLLQLKYRYDVEVDHSRRPALRKIMERDDTPAKTLVLCVCEIISKGQLLHAQICSDTNMSQSAKTKVETPVAVVRLTDGWYAIKAQLDEPLTAMLHKGRLAVGGKLIIHGAQLMGPQDGCSPLEAPDSLMLKIWSNSTRRARWDAKLGFHTDPRPFLLPVSCLYSNGGPIGCVDIFILRSYPMQWMERKSDGGVVFRSARAEEKEARRFNSHKQKAVELLFAKVQAEFEKEEEGSIKCQRRRQMVGKQDIGNLQEGEDLYEALGDDPAYLEAHLSEQQLESLQAYRRSLMEKKQAELQDRYWRALDAEDNEMSCPKRDVTPVWRLCIADSRIQSSCVVYQLNLWRPSSDLQSLLKEGRRFKVYNLVASDGKKPSNVETVQLTGTKKTQFQELQVSQEWVSSHFRQRISTDFVNLQNEEFKPLCGEVDLTGLVISVVDQQGSSPAFYLVDGKNNFVKVRCFSSLSQASLEDIVKPRVLLALSNLQLRGQSIHPTPVLYAGDLTVFSTNPKEIHLQESLDQLRNVVQGQDNFFLTAEEKLAHSIKSDGSCSSSLQPEMPVAARRQDSKTNVAFLKPIKSLGSFTPVSSNLPAATSSIEKDPKSLKRKRALDYLCRIPSPPPIFPLVSVVSPCVKKTFNPPRRSGPPSTLKPATIKATDSLVEDEWVNDEELAMIDTQALHVGNLF
ncbi:breast cancer type 2 susceptibility protein isoform X1 [Xiphophorus couchianus]|uniref:breast cancer type 2 susceptibility protein isoform X1 n=1 Tax=Xiphophorus couchianus TaxID=32473 RepID=UPI001015D4EB|nr:breast cancer type 2 susceptibility protein isoform X1 [Xiphophorus couchianus]